MFDHPKLRPLEAFPLEVEGKRLICLRDPSGLADSVALVPRQVLPLLALLDGTRDLGALQADFVRAGGDLVSREAIAGLVRQLDDAHLLEGPRLAAHRESLAAAYRAAPTRPAANAGGSYPEEPAPLRELLDGIFAAAPGPAAPPAKRTRRRAAAGAPRAAAPRRRAPRPVRALVAPHIDFARGGQTYALAYRALVDEPPPDLYVVLGTDHNGDGSRYSLTSKSYDTPLGPLATDVEVVTRVARLAGPALLRGELNHRREHSIELQAVMLRYLAQLRGAAPPPMLPILCGSFHELLERGLDPAADEALADLCGAVTEAVAGRRVVWIAGADLAHVGPQFGDPGPLSTGDREALVAHDATLLTAVAAGDAAGFFRLLRDEHDARRVCGLPPIYTMLRLCDGLRGELVGYDQCPAGDDGAWVSIAAMTLR